MPTVIVADDDQAIRLVVSHALEREGFTVRAVASGSGLWRLIEDDEGDVVVTDVLMPDANGLDLLPRIRQRRPDLPVIVMSAQNTLTTAVRATEGGAYEYLPKPFDINELTDKVRKASEQRAQGDEVPEPAPVDDLPLIGRSAAMQTVYRLIARLVPTELTVLIAGDSGTGKELVARAVHDMGKRAAGPFVAVNMAAIPRELVESELFGHEKGAFTGAHSRAVGRFEQAGGGTLFLDEIGDMPLEAQTRLLRVLQQGEYTTVGGTRPIKADVRIVAATNQDLLELIDKGRFREDLYYRLHVAPIDLPPLRQRLDDIAALADHFLAQAAAEGLGKKRLATDAVARLHRHPWPGNVRELENLMRRMAALYSDEVITVDMIDRELGRRSGRGRRQAEDTSLDGAVENHLARYFAAHGDRLPPPGLYDRILREVERPLISMSLAATRGNQIKAAELLGINRNTLRKKIRELGIRVVRGTR